MAQLLVVECIKEEPKEKKLGLMQKSDRSGKKCQKQMRALSNENASLRNAAFVFIC